VKRGGRERRIRVRIERMRRGEGVMNLNINEAFQLTVFISDIFFDVMGGGVQ
jgi:hypothetical protein